MKTYAMIGIILIAAGIVSFAYQGITYAVGNPAVAAGAMTMTAGMLGTLPILPVAGAIALIGGIVLLLTGSRNYEEVSKRQRLNRRWLR
jgi:membrane protein implicated in regulation of membrane protease activity